MLPMVCYSRRPQSGQINCYFKRTYHVLPTCIQQELAIAQAREQTLSCMCDFFQVGKTEKAATSLYGVNGTKDAGEQVPRGGIRLQLHQFLIQPIQVFPALDKNIPDQIVHCLLSTLLLLRGRLPHTTRDPLCRTQSSSAPRTFPSAAWGDGTVREIY